MSEHNRPRRLRDLDVIDVCARLAEAQHGVVSRAQLLAAGVPATAIDRRLRSGVLVGLHRGVYAIGHRLLPPWGAEMAAVLAAGPSARLSHASALALLGMVARDGDRPVDVAVYGRQARSTPTVRIHRLSWLDPADDHVRFGVPVLSSVRALAGFATQSSARDVERAFDEGRVRGVISPGEVTGYLRRHPGTPGTAALRPLVRPDRTPSVTRSPVEEWLLPHIRRSGLPAPECNARLGAFTVDLLWRAQGLAVELDGYRFHTTRSAFERDHEKDLVLRRRAIDVLRFSARQARSTPERVLVTIAGELARREHRSV